MTTRDYLKKQIQLIRKEISTCTSHGDEEEIIRIFLKALEKNIFPDMRDLLPWCLNTFGPENTEFLVKALAAWTCPVCKQGLEHCDLCSGSGMAGPELVCETCLGFGVIPCQFCGGTGLSTLETIPAGLKIAVLGARIKIATKHIKAIQSKLKNPKRELESVNSEKKQGETLLILNKLLSLLESSLDEIRQMGVIHAKDKIAVKKLSSKCSKDGILIKKLVKQVLERMINAEKHQIACHTKREVKKIYESRLEFYKELIESTPVWPGTSLEHPILDSTIERIKSLSKQKTTNKQPEETYGPDGKPDVAG